MKKYLGASLVLLLGTSSLYAQAHFRMYTEPGIPSPQELGKLDLAMGWRTLLPLDGRHDGLYTVQLTVPDGKQLLVQSQSGAIFALDAETGVIQWRTRLAKNYATALPLGYDRKYVFAVSGARLSALNRRTGIIEWETMAPRGPTAAPVADDERIYLSMATGEMTAFLLPKPEPKTAPVVTSLNAQAPVRSSTLKDLSLFDEGQVQRGNQPLPAAGMNSNDLRRLIFGGANDKGTGGTGTRLATLWSYGAESRLEMAPLLTPEFVLLGGYSGVLYAINKFDGRPLYRFPAGPPLTAQLGQYDLIAYIASQDYTVYALDILPGRILWRFVGGGPILIKPAVDDDSVYVTPEGAGLYRIERAHGGIVWQSTAAERFMASNKSFVYAQDRQGNLLVLDKSNGVLLGKFGGTRGFVFPITNEQTDRIYLGSNNGLLMSLHDRHNVLPLLMKQPPAAAVPGAKKKVAEDDDTD